MEIVTARKLKSMNASQNMFVHVSYFPELNNLASGLKGSLGRQRRFVNVTLKDQGS